MSEPAQRFELNPLASDFVPGQAIRGHEEWKEELFNHLTKIENLGIPEPTESDKKIFDEALLAISASNSAVSASKMSEVSFSSSSTITKMNTNPRPYLKRHPHPLP